MYIFSSTINSPVWPKQLEVCFERRSTYPRPSQTREELHTRALDNLTCTAQLGEELSYSVQRLHTTWEQIPFQYYRTHKIQKLNASITSISCVESNESCGRVVHFVFLGFFCFLLSAADQMRNDVPILRRTLLAVRHWPLQIVVLQPHVGILRVPFCHDVIPEFPCFLHVLTVQSLLKRTNGAIREKMAWFNQSGLRCATAARLAGTLFFTRIIKHNKKKIIFLMKIKFTCASLCL